MVLFPENLNVPQLPLPNPSRFRILSQMRDTIQVTQQTTQTELEFSKNVRVAQRATNGIVAFH
jgi:hypothetical protein